MKPDRQSQSRGRRHWRKASVVLTAALACEAFIPGLGLAQPAERAGASGPTIPIRSSVPGAAVSPQPSPDTPVAPQYQESYRAWLEMKRKANGGTKWTRENYAKMPDWSGVWTRTGGFNWNSPPVVDPRAAGIGPAAAQAMLDACASFPCKGWMEADLTPEYALRYRQKLTAVAHGFEWDQLSDCLPSGFPRFLLNPFYREFIATPNQTWLSQETQGEFRRIYTDGRGHVAEDDSLPLWEGDSIGFWDGDTLVVHTIRVRAEELQRNMPSVSQDASVIERIRMVDPNTIENVATLYDPKVLKTPWTGVHRYVRVTSPVARLDMWSCAENNNVVPTPEGASTFILPGEPGYKDPDNIQNLWTERAIAYGAKLMAEEEAKKAAGAR
jgi:hypothetical protein